MFLRWAEHLFVCIHNRLEGKASRPAANHKILSGSGLKIHNISFWVPKSKGHLDPSHNIVSGMLFGIASLMHVGHEFISSAFSLLATVPLSCLRGQLCASIERIQNAPCADKKRGPMAVERANVSGAPTPEQRFSSLVQSVVTFWDLSPVEEASHV